jgi:hypothetical protein
MSTPPVNPRAQKKTFRATQPASAVAAVETLNVPRIHHPGRYALIRVHRPSCVRVCNTGYSAEHAPYLSSPIYGPARITRVPYPAALFSFPGVAEPRETFPLQRQDMTYIQLLYVRVRLAKRRSPPQPLSAVMAFDGSPRPAREKCALSNSERRTGRGGLLSSSRTGDDGG